MGRRLAFPMYAINGDDSRALEHAVSELLAARGLHAGEWQPLQDTLLAHWQQPDLLLSQTCGYPLVTQLPQVQTVGCFHYTAPGCTGIDYRSFLVTREADGVRTLAELRGRRAVCNATDSQSGYNALRKCVAPLSVNGRFFSQVQISGSHRQSLAWLTRGEADLAAIDCVSWALLARHEPQALAGLAIIDASPPAPGLPLITAAQTPASTLAVLRSALRQLVSDPAYRDICEANLIGGFSEVSRQPYQRFLNWRDEAVALGVSAL